MWEEDKVIEADRKEHPHCSYSTNVSNSCGHDEKKGKFVCDTLKSIQRNCPNEAPVIVFRKESKGDDAGMSSIFGGLLDGFVRSSQQQQQQQQHSRKEHRGGGVVDQHDELREIRKSIEEAMGGSRQPQQDLRGVFDEFMKGAQDLQKQHQEALRAQQQRQQQQQQQQKGGGRARANARGYHQQQQQQQQHQQVVPEVPYSQEYDRLAEEAIHGLYDESKKQQQGERKGIKTGYVERV
jgi:hypothetical protein